MLSPGLESVPALGAFKHDPLWVKRRRADELRLLIAVAVDVVDPGSWPPVDVTLHVVKHPCTLGHVEETWERPECQECPVSAASLSANRSVAPRSLGVPRPGSLPPDKPHFSRHAVSTVADSLVRRQPTKYTYTTKHYKTKACKDVSCWMVPPGGCCTP